MKYWANTMPIILPAIQNPILWHQIFEVVAMAAGLQLYRLKRGEGLLGSTQFPLMIGALLGAGVGNKLVFWLERVDLWQVALGNPMAWFAGQSMVGGLLGGLLGVELAKKLTGQTQSTGDRFVYPILLALSIGRIGCFIAGLTDGTSGNPSDLPWAVDFGDGITRHPTQLYEILFAALLWLLLVRGEKRLSVVPGLQFKLMLSAYWVWRLVIDFLKPLPFEWFWGLSGIQVTCLAALILYLPLVWRGVNRLGGKKTE
jgi:phosphatidylglycerol:prolipoprotein diacylglycerol transferase